MDRTKSESKCPSRASKIEGHRNSLSMFVERQRRWLAQRFSTDRAGHDPDPEVHINTLGRVAYTCDANSTPMRPGGFGPKIQLIFGSRYLKALHAWAGVRRIVFVTVHDATLPAPEYKQIVVRTVKPSKGFGDGVGVFPASATSGSIRAVNARKGGEYVYPGFDIIGDVTASDHVSFTLGCRIFAQPAEEVDGMVSSADDADQEKNKQRLEFDLGGGVRAQSAGILVLPRPSATVFCDYWPHYSVRGAKTSLYNRLRAGGQPFCCGSTSSMLQGRPALWALWAVFKRRMAAPGVRSLTPGDPLSLENFLAYGPRMLTHVKTKIKKMKMTMMMAYMDSGDRMRGDHDAGLSEEEDNDEEEMPLPPTALGVPPKLFNFSNGSAKDGIQIYRPERFMLELPQDGSEDAGMLLYLEPNDSAEWLRLFAQFRGLKRGTASLRAAITCADSYHDEQDEVARAAGPMWTAWKPPRGVLNVLDSVVAARRSACLSLFSVLAPACHRACLSLASLASFCVFLVHFACLSTLALFSLLWYRVLFPGVCGLVTAATMLRDAATASITGAAKAAVALMEPPPGPPPPRVLVALAMNQSASDVLRRGNLEASFDGVVFVANDNVDKGKGDMEINFKLPRGVKTLVSRCSAEARKGAQVFVELDFFWLGVNYFTERYGTHWVETAVELVQSAKVARVTLPWPADRSSEQADQEHYCSLARRLSTLPEDFNVMGKAFQEMLDHPPPGVHVWTSDSSSLLEHVVDDEELQEELEALGRGSLVTHLDRLADPRFLHIEAKASVAV